MTTRKFVALLFGIAVAGAAHAYSMQCEGNACKVYCDSKELIGTMYWNGSNWSDGVRSDPKKEVVAELMVKAWVASCR